MLLARRQAMGFEWTKVRQGESAVDRAGGSFKFWTWLSLAQRNYQAHKREGLTVKHLKPISCSDGIWPTSYKDWCVLALQKRVAESTNKKHVLCSMTLTPAPHTIRHSIQYGIALSKTWHARYSSHSIQLYKARVASMANWNPCNSWHTRCLRTFRYLHGPLRVAPRASNWKRLQAWPQLKSQRTTQRWALKRYSWHSISRVVCLRISEGTAADTPTMVHGWILYATLSTADVLCWRSQNFARRCWAWP